MADFSNIDVQKLVVAWEEEEDLWNISEQRNVVVAHHVLIEQLRREDPNSYANFLISPDIFHKSSSSEWSSIGCIHVPNEHRPLRQILHNNNNTQLYM
jgi:hypothetical protein